MSIYQEIILDHYRHPRNFGIMQNPTNSCHLDNPLCGDDITIEIKLENDIVKTINFHGEGCAIAMASASMLTEKAKGKNIKTLKSWDKSIILNDLGIDLSANRLKCALLPLEVLQNAVKNKD